MKREILILTLVVLAAGCIDNTQSSPEPDTSDQTSTPTEPATDKSGDHTVYLTESGFQPSELTIQQGETVTWIKNASSSMWVGSDRHPTHTQYADSTLREHCQNGDQTVAAFDQCQTGDRFSFTFEKMGEWSYHNHKNAGQSGTILVE